MDKNDIFKNWIIVHASVNISPQDLRNTFTHMKLNLFHLSFEFLKHILKLSLGYILLSSKNIVAYQI